MSIAAPPRPTAPGATTATATLPFAPARRFGPDWLPTIGWFVEDGRRHSRINVIPTGNTTDPTERFTATLKFFRGSDQPLFTYVSEPFCGDENFRFEGRQLLAAIDEPGFEGLVEITARSLDNPPTHFPWADSWLEFYADDGTFSGSVPGFVFKGGTTKRVMSGKWQHWPGVVANDDYATTLLVLNYHPRPIDLRLEALSPSGGLARSAVLTVAPRMPAHFPLEEHIPGVRNLLASGRGVGSLRVWSAYKLPGFVAIENRRTGVVSSFDHTVPFAGTPIE